MEEQTMELQSMKTRFSTLGRIFATLVGVGFAVYFVMVLLEGWLPEAVNTEATWWVWLRGFLPTYLVGLPLCFLLLKKRVPAQPRECRSLGKKEFWALLCMGLGLMVLGNWSMNLPLRLTGKELFNRNPLAEPLRCIAGITLVPLLEELVFRKLLLDRIGHWDRKLTVLMSGVIFGLFRLDLFGFVDGLILGAFFAYVYLRTGKLRYPVIISAMINLCRLVILPGIPEIFGVLGDQLTVSVGKAVAGLVGLLTVSQAMILFIMVPSVLGIVLMIRRLRRRDWKTALKQLLRSPGLKAAFANAGMIVYVVLCLCLSVLALL